MRFEMCDTPAFMAFDSKPFGPNTMAATVASTATTTIHSTISAPRSSQTALSFDMVSHTVVLHFPGIFRPHVGLEASIGGHRRGHNKRF